MRNVVLGVVGSLFLGACSLTSESSESRIGRAVEYFCKIEGSAIGHEGFILTLGPRAIRFHDWVQKPGANGEYIGFSISIAGTASVSYVVKASTELYPSSATSWVHPDGPNGNAISNVDFCGECEDGSCGGDGGGGGGGGDGDGGGGDGGGGGGGGGGGDGDGDGDECTCDPDGTNCSGPLL